MIWPFPIRLGEADAIDGESSSHPPRFPSLGLTATDIPAFRRDGNRVPSTGSDK